MKEGLLISIIPLFTKGSGAIVCPNCKAEKELLIECTQNLAELNEDLFCSLAQGFNYEVAYQIEEDKVVDLKKPRPRDLIRLKTRKPIFSNLQLLEGAH